MHRGINLFTPSSSEPATSFTVESVTTVVALATAPAIEIGVATTCMHPDNRTQAMIVQSVNLLCGGES